MKRFGWMALVAGMAAPAAAQTTPAVPPAKAESDYHGATAADIIVTAPFRRDVGSLLSGTSVVTGTELVRDLRPSIGETLARQPGVSASSFGPNASRPILRGFQGERVRVLTDGIGSFDVSNTSADHAVVINPLTADRIEVLRGPSALLFGSSAVGGVVNVVDSRIPRHVPDEFAHIDATASYGSAADERSGSASVDVPVAGKLVFHLDGSYTKTDDLRTGGYILSPTLRARAAASADPDIAALADLKGTLPNTAARTWDVAGGVAVVTDGGNYGVSVSRYDSLYGVPVRFSLDPAIEGEQVRLDARQTRADMRAEVETGGGLLDSIKFRAGYADYQHAEIDDAGAAGTRFFTEGYEARLELVQARRGPWRGAVGGQMLIRDLNVIGDEKFLPRSETQQYGLFTLQEFDLGAVKAEAGARYERGIQSARADADLGNPDIRRIFDSVSGSLGASVAVADGWRIGLNGSRSERAPSGEELFANGPHAGTQAFEIGNPDFAKETSWGVEATLRGRGDGYSLDISAYYSWFQGYIYEAETGAVIDDLPVFQYAQAPARYYGFEIEGSKHLFDLGGFDIVADGLADYVHASIRGTGPVPRIPPLRILGGVEAQGHKFTGRIEAEHSFAQNRVTAFETPTADFTLVNASLAFKPLGKASPTTLLLSANNIFDAVARRAASVLKDYAPLSGRDIRVSARLSF